MSYSKHSYFNEDANFNEVKFGANNPVLETELNELQQIQELSKKNLIRDAFGSGLIKVPTSMAFISSSVYTLKLTGDTVAYVDGSRIFIPSGTRVSAPSGSASMLFIEVWTEEVNCDSTLNKYGGESTDTIDNYLKDPRVPKETARRIVTKWRLRCDKGTSMTSMKVRGKLSGTSTVSFSALTSGIYKGVDESASFDGVVFALPLASISSSKVVTPNYRKIRTADEVYDSLLDLQAEVDEKALATDVTKLSTNKQDKNDSSLNTENKTIVGGINELYSWLNVGLTSGGNHIDRLPLTQGWYLLFGTFVQQTVSGSSSVDVTVPFPSGLTYLFGKPMLTMHDQTSPVTVGIRDVTNSSFVVRILRDNNASITLLRVNWFAVARFTPLDANPLSEPVTMDIPRDVEEELIEEGVEVVCQEG